MDGHIFLEYMSFRMICFMRAYVLREVMLYRGHLLDEERFYWWVCLIGSHVVHDGISYRWTCLRSTCSMSGHVLLRYMN